MGTVPVQPLVGAVLALYFIYSVWSAYSTGVNHGMLKKNKIKGVVRYGPYLSLAISFVGIMLTVFIAYELFGYYAGFIRFDLPASISSLDFLSFVFKQFSLIKIKYTYYVLFLFTGIAFSSLASYVVVLRIYRKGVEKAHGG